jgi:hypothetical protein
MQAFGNILKAREIAGPGSSSLNAAQQPLLENRAQLEPQHGCVLYQPGAIGPNDVLQ